MAGPNSMPAKDRAEHRRLMQKICITPQHWKKNDRGERFHREDFKNPCVLATIRETLIARGRLRTGKTRG